MRTNFEKNGEEVSVFVIIGLMQKYDLTVITQKSDIGEKIGKVISALGGKAGRMVEMGKKQLAYPITKMSESQFFSWVVELPEDAVIQLQKKLAVDKDVVRHLLVKAEK